MGIETAKSSVFTNQKSLDIVGNNLANVDTDGYTRQRVDRAEIYETATEDWCKAGNKKADLKELAVYVKPEESAIYYVVNGSETGKVEF